jgi:hypothetical protein
MCCQCVAALAVPRTSGVCARENLLVSKEKKLLFLVRQKKRKAIFLPYRQAKIACQ